MDPPPTHPHPHPHPHSMRHTQTTNPPHRPRQNLYLANTTGWSYPAAVAGDPSLSESLAPRNPTLRFPLVLVADQILRAHPVRVYKHGGAPLDAVVLALACPGPIAAAALLFADRAPPLHGRRSVLVTHLFRAGVAVDHRACLALEIGLALVLRGGGGVRRELYLPSAFSVRLRSGCREESLGAGCGSIADYYSLRAANRCNDAFSPSHTLDSRTLVLSISRSLSPPSPPIFCRHVPRIDGTTLAASRLSFSSPRWTLPPAL